MPNYAENLSATVQQVLDLLKQGYAMSGIYNSLSGINVASLQAPVRSAEDRKKFFISVPESAYYQAVELLKQEGQPAPTPVNLNKYSIDVETGTQIVTPYPTAPMQDILNTITQETYTTLPTTPTAYTTISTTSTPTPTTTANPLNTTQLLLLGVGLYLLTGGKI